MPTGTLTIERRILKPRSDSASASASTGSEADDGDLLTLAASEPDWKHSAARIGDIDVRASASARIEREGALYWQVGLNGKTFSN